MVVIIANFLLHNAPETYQKQGSYSRRLDAEALLTDIEKAGMIPPNTLLGLNEGKPVHGRYWDKEN